MLSSTVNKNKIKPRKFDRLLEKCSGCNVIKSTRRVIFVGSDSPDPLKFKADHFGGMGSGILIKMNGAFFVLTAKHVITNQFGTGFKLGDELPNVSPFWVPMRNKTGDLTQLESYLFPKKIWDISELIQKEVDGVDTTDICLLEMCPPHSNAIPDNFIEIETIKDVQTEENFYPGKFHILAGFPFSGNGFEYETNKPGFTHESTMQRAQYFGQQMIEEGCITHQDLKKPITHNEVTGISGGAVTDVQFKANAVKLCGMIVSSSGGTTRYIPSYVFIDALLNYQNANSYIVDPMAVDIWEINDNPELLKKIMTIYQGHHSTRPMEHITIPDEV